MSEYTPTVRRIGPAAIVLLGALGACSRPPAEEHVDDHDHAAHDSVPGDDAHHATLHSESCEDDVSISAEALQRYGIEVAPVRRVPLVAVVQAPARIALRASAVSRLGSPVLGRIVELPAQAGDEVEQGALLAVIESPELGDAQIGYLQERTRAQAIAPTVEITRASWERAKELFDSVQGISLTEVQSREVDLRAAEQALALARASESAARNRLLLLGMQENVIDELAVDARISPRFELRAPIAGRVIERPAVLGELVGPEKDSLMTLADTRRLWVLAHVPEGRLSEIAVGAPARIAIAALGPEEIEGTVGAIAPVLDADTRTAEVRIDVENPEGRLLPGMYALAHISGGDPAGATVALVVPDEAVQTVEGEPAVFVPIDEESRTFCKHAVRVGEPVGDSIPVYWGLVEGDLVAVSGTFLLKAELGKSAAAHEH